MRIGEEIGDAIGDAMVMRPVMRSAMAQQRARSISPPRGRSDMDGATPHEFTRACAMPLRGCGQGSCSPPILRAALGANPAAARIERAKRHCYASRPL
jgi:hypothetical protein